MSITYANVVILSPSNCGQAFSILTCNKKFVESSGVFVASPTGLNSVQENPTEIEMERGKGDNET